MSDKDIVNVLNILELINENALEKHFLEMIRNQNICCPNIHWGNNLSVLIMVDRAFGRAQGLLEFLKSKTQFSHLQLTNSIEDAIEYLKINIPDIIIFAGTQTNKRNYDIIDEACKLNPNAFPVMYAAKDQFVENECRLHNIYCIGDCYSPLDLFIMSIKKCYALHLKEICRSQAEKANLL